MFTAEASGFMVELSTSYIVLTVRTQSYASFEDYASIFCYIADTYRKKIDFFTVKRFGLRKINFCFVKDKAKITKYFSESYYNCEEPISDFTTKDKSENTFIKYVRRLRDTTKLETFSQLTTLFWGLVQQ